jgi:type II secretory pathway pseudopilin PulG
MFLMAWEYNKQGISIIEILVVSSIIAIALTSILGLASFALRVSNRTQETVRANFLAKEIIEAARAVRGGTDWSTDGLGAFSPGSPYHPELQATATADKWILATGEETVGIYKRKIVFDKVSRDLASKNIEPTYNQANDDPDTRKITATVSWQKQKVEITTYLTNWR